MNYSTLMENSSEEKKPSDARLVAKADRSILSTLQMFGMDNAPPPNPLTPDSPYEERVAYCTNMEKMFGELSVALVCGAGEEPGITLETVVIKGVDDNDIKLLISYPPDFSPSSPRPCVYHIHGGGMSVFTVENPLYTAYRNKLSSHGVIVIGVDFRNAAGVNGTHRFPAGLNDCMSGLQWVHDNKAAKGISKVVVSGDSGGGNLSLAATLKAKRDGKLDQIDGVYAMCPYICGAWKSDDPQVKALFSVVENDNLFLSIDDMCVMASIYLPDGVTPQDTPLAWPFWASVDDLQGLPPHVINVNELDPLRDEGIAYYRKLLEANVNVRAQVALGTVHGTEGFFMHFAPHISNASFADIAAFANNI